MRHFKYLNIQNLARTFTDMLPNLKSPPPVNCQTMADFLRLNVFLAVVKAEFG